MRITSKVHIKLSYALCIVLVGIFSFLRIYRNSYGYTSSQAGGPWNYVALIFLFFSVLIAVGIIKTQGKTTLAIKYALGYALFAFINCLIRVQMISFSNLYYLLMIWFYPSILWCFFHFGKNSFTKKHIKITNIVFFCIGILALLSMIGFRVGVLNFVMVSNAYYVLCFWPIVLLLNEDNLIIKIASYILTGVVLLLSTKRTGILAYIIAFFCIMVIDAIIKNRLLGFLKGIFKVICALLVASVVYFFISERYEIDVLERLMLLQSDGGSGRDIMWAQIWDAMTQSNFFEWLLGHGMDSSRQVLIIHDDVHNDFLQVLYEYGLLPFIFLVLHYGNLIKVAYRMLKMKYLKTGIMIAGIVIGLFMSMFSVYCIDFSYSICGACFLGLILGKWEKDKLLEGEEIFYEVNNSNNFT